MHELYGKGDFRVAKYSSIADRYKISNKTSTLHVSIISLKPVSHYTIIMYTCSNVERINNQDQ